MEKSKNKYKYTFEKLKSGIKNIDFNVIPSFQTKIYRSLSTPNLFYKKKSNNIFNLDQTIQFEKMPYKNVYPDFSLEVEFDDFNNYLTRGNRIQENCIFDKNEVKSGTKNTFGELNSFKENTQDNYETPKLASVNRN